MCDSLWLAPVIVDTLTIIIDFTIVKNKMAIEKVARVLATKTGSNISVYWLLRPPWSGYTSQYSKILLQHTLQWFSIAPDLLCLINLMYTVKSPNYSPP